MDYTSIHIYGHFLSDDILHAIEQDNTLIGNREQDFGLDSQVQNTIDYVWSSLRNDWRYFKERSTVNDPYGTRRSRDLMERFFKSLGYNLTRQLSGIVINGVSHDIPYLCNDLKDMPVIVVGDKTGESDIDTLDKCTLDYRAKGAQRKKSPHAVMLEYLNNTENVYGIIANGKVLRLIRNTGQLVKLTYIEFDIQRMLEEDKYTEFCLMFRLLHSSRFRVSGDEQCVIERYFNMSIESGNRIRDGLSLAVQRTMETIGRAALKGNGEGNEVLRAAILERELSPEQFNKELIHFIYRLLFLFIIEERNLIYQIPNPEHPDYKRLCKLQEVYKQYYAASRLRQKSELAYLRQKNYHDLWDGLMDTFRLFENEAFGEPLGIKPLGGVLFNSETLKYLKRCVVSNSTLLEAFNALNEFRDERQQLVKINYSSLDVEEFGSVYEGILEMRPYINQGVTAAEWEFGFVGGLDRKSTSSYYTRPDLVQSLIKTTLVPVIEKKLKEGKTTEEKIKALLNMKVCDAASGSGHIVLAMARTIAWYVCTLRTGEDNPASLDYREALREVIQKCIYAVDYNPDAVELCKVVLWIEGYCAGMPLSFLDHHIRCGNSVVGVTDLDTLLKGVPKEAFSTTDNVTKRRLIELNQDALREVDIVQRGQGGHAFTLFNQDFFIQNIDKEQIGLANQVSEIASLPENNLLQMLTKQNKWEDLMHSPRVECLRRACDVYTYAFYKQFEAKDLVRCSDETGIYAALNIPYTRTVFQALQEIKYLDNKDEIENVQHLPESFRYEIDQAARKHRFFHWCVEFPEVFAYNGGFDVMCGNPPWDKLQMEDEKWFVGKNPDIVNAPNQAARNSMITNLAETNPKLLKEYKDARNTIASQSNYIKNGVRFSLCNRGKIELSSLFAELCLQFAKEAWGLVIPTSIATSDGNKIFFAKLIEENRLISIFDFYNSEGIFDIHRQFKFCLLTVGEKRTSPRDVRGGFYLTRIDHLNDPNRIYSIETKDFITINPNTKNCAVFRTKKDADITKKIYRLVPIMYNEATQQNPWGIQLGTLFNMASDSKLFMTRKQLLDRGGTLDNNAIFIVGNTKYVPLYEGKLFYIYNHHYGEFPNEGKRPNSIDNTPSSTLNDPSSSLVPWYWIKKEESERKHVKYDSSGKLIWEWKHNYHIGFRDVTNSTSVRTCICSLLPGEIGAGDKAPLIFPTQTNKLNMCLLAMISSITFDYITRQKVGGLSLAFFIMKQLPFLPPSVFSDDLEWKIVKRVILLCYFNHDLDGWAEELWEEMTPKQRAEIPELGRKECFIYDPDKRAVWQAELDAIFAHLYGLTTEELRYILDPEDVCGKGCINETFRVLKDNEIREFGEYRTKRLVMEAWYRFGYDN